ncbi:MAG: GTP cyclohydrolase I FolE2 [Alphaproteobacteria bacterium]|nr:GTP cyclohydrolase I FolE2 [Alphaproteobacteria bacterium]
MPVAAHRDALPDHAAEADHRALPIDQVGIRGLSYPITVWDRDHQKQHTVGEISLSVALPSEFKGTHMSRFIEILNARRGELSLGTVPDILAEVQRRLEAEEAFIEVAFPYFLSKRAPVSGAESLMEYRCRFVASRKGEALDFMLEVTVPVKTLCPCSKAVSRYGAHNQRGLVTARARFEGMLWIEDVVEDVEACASAPLFALLKREDEKWVTEHAYENPRFVEDLVREVVQRLRRREGVRWLEVTAENVESIHNHSAWARIAWPQGDAPEAPVADTPSAPPFGEWLRAQREARRQSQRELAQRLSLSPSLLSRVERGEKRLPPERLDTLAASWGLDPLWLAVKAGALPESLLERVRSDPEGFLAWAGQR